MSLWQVPPCNPHPHSTSIPSSSPPLSSPPLRPGLSLWQVPPEQYPPTPFSPLLPSPLTCFFPQRPLSYPSSGPACHCGRSRLVPLLTLLAPLPFWIPHSILCHSFGPACHCGWPRLPHSHCLPFQLLLSLSSSTPSKSPACHCGRSRLTFLFYPSHHSVSPSSLSLSLFSCRPTRAGRHGRSKVILLTLFQSRSTSDLTGFSALREVPVAPDCLAVPHLPVPCHYAGLRRLAVLRFYVFDGGYGSLLRPCRVLLAVQDHLSGF